MWKERCFIHSLTLSCIHRTETTNCSLCTHFSSCRLWQSLVLQAQAAVPRRDRLRDCLPREHLQGRLPRLSSAEPLLPGVGSHGYSGLNWRGQRCGWVWVLRAFLSGEGELPRAARQPLGSVCSRRRVPAAQGACTGSGAAFQLSALALTFTVLDSEKR